MFPCEMARHIAVFSREARKYGHFRSRRAHDIDGSGSAHAARSGPDRGLICFMSRTSDRSPGTSSLPPLLVCAGGGGAARGRGRGTLAAGDVVAGVVVVADLFSGVSFALGLVALGTGPVVAGVFGLTAAPLPDAARAGDVVAGIVVVGVVVADLVSGPGFVFGVVTPTGPVVPLGNAGPFFMPGRVLSAGSVVGATFVCNVVGVVPF